MARRRVMALAILFALLMSTQATTLAAAAAGPTRGKPMLRLEANAPKGSKVTPLISSGDTIGGFEFQGIPDGIGLVDNGDGSADVYVAHEESHVPFRGLADLQDASISRLTISSRNLRILDASVALPASAGFIRFCSAFMAGLAEGFTSPVFFANEESDDDLDVPAGAPYGADPAIAPQREAGYTVAYDVASGTYRPIPGMGRLNHENTVVVPGDWSSTVALTGDDTFAAPSSQLYLYSARSPEAMVADEGRLFAFRVTRTQDGPVVPPDPHNGANDYGDITIGDDWQGEFIRVPTRIARGQTTVAPQRALEDWSNENNVFQFIRVEDIAYDPDAPNVVYFADTGEPRAIADPTSGRLQRGPSDTRGPYPNGRMFRIELDPSNPRKVASFSILLDADAGGYDNPDVMHAPDNIDVSASSLMVQEDSSQPPESRIWRYDLGAQTWSVVASVRDQDWESSGIVDASAVFGEGAWLVDVQAHDVFVEEDTTTVPGVTLKQEGGQLLLLRLPGTT